MLMELYQGSRFIYCFIIINGFISCNILTLIIMTRHKNISLLLNYFEIVTLHPKAMTYRNDTFLSELVHFIYLTFYFI